MKRGDTLTVSALQGKTVERILWEEHPTWVMLCRPEIYEEAIRQRLPEPSSWMGFPKEDIVVGASIAARDASNGSVSTSHR